MGAQHSARAGGRAVATFALIPEVIAFSCVAGVDPSVGLFASFVFSLVIAVTGGRPAMVSAAAGSVALVGAPLVQSHRLGYLLAAGLLAGAVQVAFGLMKLGVLMRFVSSSVRTGFVNALATLIFAAQLPHLHGASTATWGGRWRWGWHSSTVCRGWASGWHGLRSLPFRHR